MRPTTALMISLLLLPAVALASTVPLSWDGSVARQGVWPNLAYTEDPTHEAGPEDVATRDASSWRLLPDAHTHLGWRDTAVWARFAIANPTETVRQLVLVHEQTFVDSVRLFRRSDDGRWLEVAGLRDAKAGWFGGARNPAFPVLVDGGDTADYLLRTENRSLLRLPLVVFDTAHFIKREQRNYLMAGALLVIPFSVSIFILLLWRIRTQRALMLTVSLIGAEILGAAWVGGMLSVVMPWVSPITLGRVGVLSWIATLFFGFLHARHFLHLARDAPRVDALFRWAPLALLPCLVLELSGASVGRLYLIVAGLVCLALFLGVSTWQTLRRQPYAYFYTLAWGTYFVSVSVGVANLFGVMPPNVSNVLLFAQGSIASMLFALAVVGQMRDQEVRMQDELQSSHQRFRLAAEGAAVGLFDWHAGAADMELSGTARRLIGADRRAPYNARDILQVVPTLPRQQLLRTLAIAIRTGQRRLGLALEIEGRRIYVSGAFDYRRGRATRFSGSISDTSELRELERARARELVLDEFRVLFENAPIGLYRARSDGKLLRANPELLAMTAAPNNDLSTLSAASWHQRNETFTQLMQATHDLGWMVGFEYDTRAQDGQPVARFIEYTRLAETFPDGSFVYEGAVQDISTRYQLEHALREANAATSKAIADRSRLFAATNHDLRQPLQSIGLFLELMAMRELDPQSQHWIRQLRAAQLSMADTLDGLLALSRMEAGQLKPQLGPVSLTPMFDQLRGEYQPMAEAKGLKLRIAPANITVMTDSRLLERMLRNLISNAIRYTESGRIWVGCRRRGQDVAIQVRDTGPGISESAQQMIFEAYERLDNEQYSQQGFGLGLAIVRGLAELVGARVALRSRLGSGATFEVTLAAVRGSVAPILVESEREVLPSISGLNVLVVDDERMVREALTALLKVQGADVRSACDGVQALTITQADWRPHAIVIDYQLQGELGTELHARLCRQLGSSIPGVVLSGDAISPETAPGLVLMRKPVSPAQLLAALQTGFIMSTDIKTSSGRRTLAATPSNERPMRTLN